MKVKKLMSKKLEKLNQLYIKGKIDFDTYRKRREKLENRPCGRKE